MVDPFPFPVVLPFLVAIPFPLVGPCSLKEPFQEVALAFPFDLIKVLDILTILEEGPYVAVIMEVLASLEEALKVAPFALAFHIQKVVIMVAS